jgi:hypothetical protein
MTASEAAIISDEDRAVSVHSGRDDAGATRRESDSTRAPEQPVQGLLPAGAVHWLITVRNGPKT